MMKRKPMILLTALVLLVSLLTGCMGMITETVIRADGSGTITMRAGIDKEFYEEYLASMGEEMSGQADDSAEEQETFVYNGRTYLGQIETIEFANIDELTRILEDDMDAMEEQSAAFAPETQTGSFSVTRADDGVITITITPAPETETPAETQLPEDAGMEDLGLSQEEMAALVESMALVMEFSLPADVAQIAGSSDGVTISGSRLTIDLTKADMTQGELVFRTAATGSRGGQVVSVDVAAKFTDVSSGDWFYAAVKAAYDKKVMQGVDVDKFDPQGTLTYAQFATILGNRLGWKAGEKNGYWAYDNIMAALEAGYIRDLGDVTPEHYNVAIPREEAISAMVKLLDPKTTEVRNDLSASDIPDYQSITEEYRDAIVLAYRYGVTGGKDAAHTFDPKASLTRAEISQLLLNVGLLD
jgi:hypothetical protein